MTDETLSLLGLLVWGGGGGAGVAYLLFRFLGERWIENKFASRLERLRHEHARELERLRADVNAMLSATVRLQEKEFEVLSEAWGRLFAAMAHVQSVVSPMQQYADVDRMSEDQLREFLDGTEFTKWQKDEILSASNKGEVYRNLDIRYRTIEARSKLSDFQWYVERNSVFLSAGVREKFERAEEMLRHATISKEVGGEARDFAMQHDAWRQLSEEFKPLYEETKLAVQKRLGRHSGTDG